MISAWFTSLVLLGFAEYCLGQGYVCDGKVAYSAEPMTEEERSQLRFLYGKHEVEGGINECAEKCFKTEFCKMAIFTAAERLCEYSYAKPDCKDRRVQQIVEVLGPLTAVSCFKCLGSPIGPRWLGIARHGNITVLPPPAPVTTIEVPSDATDFWQRK